MLPRRFLMLIVEVVRMCVLMDPLVKCDLVWRPFSIQQWVLIVLSLGSADLLWEQ